MKTELSGKVALVGGAGSGIGKGCAIQLAKEGVNLALLSRTPERLNSVAEEIKKISQVEVITIPVDLSDISQIGPATDQVLKKFGKIDILVVNSGGPKPGKFFDLTRNDWDTSYHSVLYYAIELYQRIIPVMKTNNWGRIINIASISVKEPNEGLVLSNVFRTGLISLAKSLSKELIKSNITINSICPSAIDTDRANQLIKLRAEREGLPFDEMKKKIESTLPSSRFNSISEIGDLAVYLASENAGGITGTTIQLDGGSSSGLL
jgi:3-oxoacyl-[acyl-carrier protein] reductase